MDRFQRGMVATARRELAKVIKRARHLGLLPYLVK